MCRKYFFKNKGCLSRKFIASGLSAVFGAGMFSSYAGAMDEEILKDSMHKYEQYLKNNLEKTGKEFFDFCEKEVEIPQGNDFLKFMDLTQEEINSFNSNKDNARKIPTKKEILSKFIEEHFSNVFGIEGAKRALIDMKSNEKKFKEIIKRIVNEKFEIGNVIKNIKSQILINEQGNMKPKIVVGLIVVGLIVVGLSVYFSKRGSSKQPETEQPTNPDKPGTNPDNPGTNPDNPGTNPDNPGTNPDNPGTNLDNPGTNPDNPEPDPDNPGTNPDNPGTNPDKPGTNPDNPEPEPDSESDNTEDVQDSLGTKLLKGLGTAAVGGTLAGSGAYAVNEVLRNKESKKVQSKDVNNGEKDGYIYVASLGNELVEENGNKDNGDDSKKGSRSNEIEEEKLEAEVEDGTESAELEENTKEEDESQ